MVVCVQPTAFLREAGALAGRTSTGKQAGGSEAPVTGRGERVCARGESFWFDLRKGLGAELKRGAGERRHSVTVCVSGCAYVKYGKSSARFVF